MLEPVFPAAGSSEPPLTLANSTRRLRSLFQEAALASPGLDARLLTAEACGLSAEEAILKSGMALTSEQAQKLASFAARRLSGEPVSRIIGRREFWGMSFAVSAATLDPRPESELLVEAVLDYVKSKGLLASPLHILDLGTGSGCLLGALLSEMPASWGVGIDRSQAALETAQDNLSRLGLLDRASLLCGDWLSAVAELQFDAIVCNPPYIETGEIGTLGAAVRDYDPGLALEGGEDGLDAYRAIIPQAAAALRVGGLLVCEVGHRQSGAVLELMQQTTRHEGFSTITILKDLAGAERAVAGVRQL